MERGDLTGTLLDGRYRVLEPVAEGAMGVVYRAERVKLGRIVAIKVLHDVLPDELSGRKRFEIEAMAMAKLEHPHCASVLDVGIHDDRPYVVMDFVSGENLKDLIATGPQPIPRAAEIVRQVLSGLAHAHEHGIIHRDIKPANIVLSQKTGLGDHVKILDFGLARLHDTGQNLTTGIVVGTPAYMAPEQIRGVLLDHRVDLYACGVLLFELLTGHKPFHSEQDDPIEVCRMHLSSPIPRLSDLLPGVDFGMLEDIVGKALAKDSADRYGSAQAYAEALEAAAPRRPSLPSLPSLPGPYAAARATGPAQLASADVVAVDASLPPELEVRSADVMSAIAADPAEPALVAPAAAPGAARDARARTATPVAGVARRAVTPALGSARGGTEAPNDASEAAIHEPVSRPGTFLGLPVTPSAGTMARKPVLPAAGPAGTAGTAGPAGPAGTAGPAGPAGTAGSASSAGMGDRAEPPAVARAHRLPRRRRVMLAAGAVAAGIAVLALVASRGHHGGTAERLRDAGVASGAQPPDDPARDIVTRADALAAQGDKAAALELLARAHRQYPDSAEVSYAAGRLCFASYYWTEGLKNFRAALRSDPAYRTDPELIKIVLRGFITTPSYNEELARFLREDIGSAAQSFLEETARDHPNPAIRNRAASELRRWH